MECPIRHCETEFGQGKDDNKMVAKILDVSCTAEGLDPRGRVSDAWIKIEGPVAGARVGEVGLCSREVGKWKSQWVTDSHFAGLLEPSQNQWDKPSQNCTFATLVQGEGSSRCILDVPLALCRSPAAEVAIGDHVGLLLISTSTALVVKPATKPGAFVRVGYFKRQTTDINFFKPTSPVMLV